MEIRNGIFLRDLTLSSHYSDSEPNIFVVSKQTSSQQENISVNKQYNSVAIGSEHIHPIALCMYMYVRNCVLKCQGLCFLEEVE